MVSLSILDGVFWADYTEYNLINRPNDCRVVCLGYSFTYSPEYGCRVLYSILRTEYGIKEVQKDIPTSNNHNQTRQTIAQCALFRARLEENPNLDNCHGVFLRTMREKGLNKRISLCTMSKITQGYYGSSCEYCTWFAHLLPRTVLALSSRKLWDFIWISGFLHLHECEDRWGLGKASRFRCFGDWILPHSMALD